MIFEIAFSGLEIDFSKSHKIPKEMRYIIERIVVIAINIS
jgi:hypothetical protein